MLTSALLLLGAQAGVKHCASMFDGFDLTGDAYNILLTDCTWYNSAINVLSDFAMAAWLGGVRDMGLVAYNAANGGYRQCSEATNLPDNKNDWNDRVSSVYVMPGCSMYLYEHADRYQFYGVWGYWNVNRGQMGGRFQAGHIYNLFDPYNNKVSKFHCYCEHDEWQNFWAAIRDNLKVAGAVGRRLTTEDSTSSTATATSSTATSSTTVSEALTNLQAQALAAATAGTEEPTTSLPDGFGNNGEYCDPTVAGWDTLCMFPNEATSCPTEASSTEGSTTATGTAQTQG